MPFAFQTFVCRTRLKMQIGGVSDYFYFEIDLQNMTGSLQPPCFRKNEVGLNMVFFRTANAVQLETHNLKSGCTPPIKNRSPC